MANHEIIVGNIGTVYSGTDKERACQKYWSYVVGSKAVYGRAVDEDVTWFLDHEIYKEYIGTLHQGDTDNE